MSAGVHIVALLSLLLMMMVETSYRDTLREDSTSFIEGIQEGSSKAKEITWDVYSNLGVASAVSIPPFVFLLVQWKRLKAMYYVVFITACLFVMNVSKLWYHEQRPFWVPNTNIEAYSCSTQFGNPSGHSLFSMGMAMVLWLDFNEFGMRAEDGHWCKPIWVRLIALVVALTFTFTIGYSRAFLGVHSWN